MKRFATRGAEAVAAVDGVDLRMEPGELLVLLGPSGCGKTTMLRCLAGLERPDSGRIVMGGEVVYDQAAGIEEPTHRRDLGMVFQNYALWPHLKVVDNVAYPLQCRGMGRAERRQRAREALRLVECEAQHDRLPSALSGGQQQRVALARALVHEPGLLLFDEPLSNLDQRLRVQLRYELRDLHRKLGFTGVYVTHDQGEALQLGSRVAVMRSGKVEQIGTPSEVFADPVSPYVARFLGIDNCLRVVNNQGRWTSPSSSLAVLGAPRPADGEYDLYVRASDMGLLPAGANAPAGSFAFAGGVVRDVIFAGTDSEWVVDVDGTSMRVTARAGSFPFQRSDVVTLVVPVDRSLLYGADGPSPEPAGA